MRFNSGQCGVKCQFTDRNAHAVSSQISESQNSFAVSDDNSADIFFGPVTQHAVDVSFIVNGDKQTARSTIDDTKLLTGQTHGRCVNDGHHVLDILRKNAVKQALVTIL